MVIWQSEFNLICMDIFQRVDISLKGFPSQWMKRKDSSHQLEKSMNGMLTKLLVTLASILSDTDMNPKYRLAESLQYDIYEND